MWSNVKRHGYLNPPIMKEWEIQWDGLNDLMDTWLIGYKHHSSMLHPGTLIAREAVLLHSLLSILSHRLSLPQQISKRIGFCSLALGHESF